MENRPLSVSLDPVAVDSPGRFAPTARHLGLPVLIVAEALFFTMRFDAPKSFPPGTWWAPVFLQAHFIGQWLLVTVAAIGLFGGHRLWLRLCRAFAAQDPDDPAWSSRLIAHGVAVACFAGLSAFVCEGDLLGSARPWAWVLAWVASGLAMAATWMAAILEPAAWLKLARRSRDVLAMGLVVGLAAFAAGRQTGVRWLDLADSTLAVVRAMLGLVANDVTCDPAGRIIGVGAFRVGIDPVCSGFEGIGLTWTFLTAYLWWSRKSLRWPRAYLLVPIGTVTIWLANAVRIAALVLIGAWGSPEVAIGGFHSQAGWIAFLAVSFGLVLASRRSAFFAAVPRDSGEGAATWSNPTASYLAPFLAIVATTMLTGAFSAGFDVYYGLRIVTAGAALWYFRHDLAGIARGVSWVGVGVGVAAFGLWMALEPTSGDSAGALASGIAALPPGKAWAWVALRVIGSVAVVPLAEELAFRGYLARRLIAADFESVPMGRFAWSATLISSAAFGLLHGRWLAGMLVGLLYTLAVCRRGKLGDAVLAHAVTNALIAATVLATGDWSLWA